MENIQLSIGMPAPDFNIVGSDRKQHSLSNYRGKKIILYFYPKDNTSGWTNEALSFKDNVSALEELNAVVIGVSRDSLAAHDKFIEKFQLPFILLSDDTSILCNSYGVLKEKTMYGKKSIGIERSTFIINEEGIIEKIYRKVKVSGHVEDILEYLKSK